MVLAPVLAIGVIVTEMAMDLDADARAATYRVYIAATLLALGLYAGVRWLAGRLPSISLAVAAVGVATVGVAGLAVVLAANSMFFSAHDRDVLLVVLGVGAALAVALAAAIGSSVAGDLRRVQMTARRVGAGELSMRTGVARSDEIGEMAAAMDAMIERLEATEEERRILLASVGHDLRTPLASLRAAIEAVEDGVVDDPTRYLDGMAKDVAYLGRLVDDLFEYARIESGRYAPAPETVDLRELVDESVEVATPIAERNGVELVVLGNGPAPAEADPAAMRRVLRNLIDNAIRHTGPDGTVTIEVGTGGFRVIDDGPGFPAEFRDRAFDRFTRADESRPGGTGAGLGLAIARGLVEAHEGTIRILDGPGGRVAVSLSDAR